MPTSFLASAARHLAALTFSLWAVALTSGAAHADSSRDAWITTKTKIALITTSHLPSHSVHVDTVDGHVLLHGKVATPLERDNAGSVARSIEGVADVRNLLQVVAPAAEQKVAASDEQIKDKIDKGLKADARLDQSSITVVSVDKGAVVLSGKARNLTAHLAALECAVQVPGVRSVTSEVKAGNTLDEVAGARPRAGGNSSALDGWITMSAKMKLMSDGDVPALDIGVDTHDGTVTLFGIVPTAAAKEAAETDTRKIDSVRGVDNELQIVASSKRDWVDSKDEIVTRDVKTALKSHPKLKHVDIKVKNGVVRLTGKVPSGWQRLEAATLVRATKGVRAVDDDLQP